MRLIVDRKGFFEYNIYCDKKLPVLKNLGTEYGRRGKWMSEIRVGENETLESALRRFKRKCARAGVLAEIRKREHYEKPSVKRKKKAEAARKRKH